MDLTKEFPRSPFDRLGGIDHLKRLIDKAKAKNAETLGEYIYNCPLDAFCLTFLEMDPETFARIVASTESDDEVLAWVLDKCPNARNPDKVHSFNLSYEALSPDTPEKWQYFIATRDAIDPSRTDIRTWTRLIDLEEKRILTV
ncbi:MAG: DUF5069 domain-containing protein [Leptospirillum sp.]|jgi:hypothetical protein